MIKIQENITWRDIPEKAITIQWLNTDKDSIALGHKEGAVGKVKEDVSIKVMFQPDLSDRWATGGEAGGECARKTEHTCQGPVKFSLTEKCH